MSTPFSPSVKEEEDAKKKSKLQHKTAELKRRARISEKVNELRNLTGCTDKQNDAEVLCHVANVLYGRGPIRHRRQMTGHFRSTVELAGHEALKEYVFDNGLSPDPFLTRCNVLDIIIAEIKKIKANVPASFVTPPPVVPLPTPRNLRTPFAAPELVFGPSPFAVRRLVYRRIPLPTRQNLFRQPIAPHPVFRLTSSAPLVFPLPSHQHLLPQPIAPHPIFPPAPSIASRTVLGPAPFNAPPLAFPLSTRQNLFHQSIAPQPIVPLAPSIAKHPIFRQTPSNAPHLIFRPTPSDAPHPIFRPTPSDAPHPIFRPTPSYAPHPIFRPTPSYAPHPIFRPTPSYAPQPVGPSSSLQNLLPINNLPVFPVPNLAIPAPPNVPPSQHHFSIENLLSTPRPN